MKTSTAGAFGLGVVLTMLLFETSMAQNPTARNGVLVELFTSQGCSSCPPAEKVFSQIEKMSDRAIPIALHVDYWDPLGWKDPFGSSAHSERQKQYGAVFRLNSIYTPQAVVAGRTQMNGSDADSIISAVAKEQGTAVSFDLKTYAPSTGAKAGAIGVTLHMKSQFTLSHDLVIFAVVTENGLQTQIKAGENAGRVLVEDHVVRRFIEVAGLNPSETQAQEGVTRNLMLILDSAWKRSNLGLVVFAQERESMRVLGAARIPLK